MGLRDWLTRWLGDFLREPLGHYEQRGWHDFSRLRESVKVLGQGGRPMRPEELGPLWPDRGKG